MNGLTVLLGADYDDHDTQEASKHADIVGYWRGRTRLFTKLLDQIDIPIYLILGPNDVACSSTFRRL